VGLGTAQATSDAWRAVGILARVGCEQHSDCDDGDACTTDVCAGGAMRACTHASVSCSDGNACNGVETCDPSSGCRPSAEVRCDDGMSCTIDACDENTGSCSVSSVESGLDTREVCAYNSQCCSGRCRLKRCL
jgi:hypothetical protein